MTASPRRMRRRGAPRRGRGARVSPAPVFAETARSTPAGGAAARSRLGADPQPRVRRRDTGVIARYPRNPEPRARARDRPARYRARVRETPSISIGSLVSRRPAVSTKVTGNPQRSQRTSMASRVVPGIAETMATSRRAMALRSVDFPAFGGPARTTVKPSRRRSPRWPSARWRASSSATCFRQSRGLFLHSSRDIGLVREVERRLEQRQAFDQPLAPALDQAAEPPLELAQGLAALRLGLGVDEVGQALDGREVHPAVEEGAAGELARLRGAAARQAGERPQHGGAHRKTAMEVKLGLVLAGEALRPRHPGDERLVERFARGGVAKHRERHPPRRRQAAGHRLEHAGGAGPAYAGRRRSRRARPLRPARRWYRQPFALELSPSSCIALGVAAWKSHARSPHAEARGAELRASKHARDRPRRCVLRGSRSLSWAAEGRTRGLAPQDEGAARMAR